MNVLTLYTRVTDHGARFLKIGGTEKAHKLLRHDLLRFPYLQKAEKDYTSKMRYTHVKEN